ncbi:MAG: Ig-like domain-containing protein, partial [Lachnospiraceae bacterium]|nr:Ig-like domain-containing protein [Lachnospiraceae bacterium]
ILHTKEGYQLFADVIGYPDGVDGNMTPTNKAITWVSSDESVVKVSQYQGEASKGGAVTTVGPGYATVMAITEDGQKLDSFNFIIREKVTSVTLPYTSLDVNQESERIQLVATVSPDYPTTDRGIVWTSSDPTVAEVDEFGVVTFKKPGYTSIKATSTDNIEASATCMINVRIPVTGVTVDKTEAKMKVGETLRIIAEVSPANAANKNVTWSSTDTSVVTVSDTGLCTAKAGGSATIVVRTQDGGFVATCMITVYQEVESIRLSKTTARVGRGSTIRLRATVLPETATNKKVTWSSSDNSIATVNQDGEVTGLKIGDPVIITATTVSGNKMATCKVTVTEPVTGLIISPTSKTLKKGQYFTIKATVYPTDRVTNDTVLWASSNPKVAKVDSKGKVTAVAGGKATIQAKTEDQGFLGFCTVTVIEKVSKITLNHKSAYLSKGQKLTLKATVSNSTATNKKVVWTSSNKKVATVNSKGQVVAKGNGTTTIKVKATDGSGKYATCTIRVITRTTSVRLNQYYMTCIKGRSYRLTAKVYPTNASIKKIKWTSSNPKVARVSQSGIVTAVGKGTCKITATNLAPGNKRATCNVTVINPIPTTAITLNKDEITLVKGGTTKITARKIPANTTEATKWMSNNPEVARVNQVGVVTGIRPGKTTIVAYTASGMEATCAVEIVAINRTSLTLEAYDRYTMYVDGAEEGVLWSSSNPSVATINATTGAVFAVKAGTTVLTATYKGCKMTCVLRVRDVS